MPEHIPPNKHIAGDGVPAEEVSATVLPNWRFSSLSVAGVFTRNRVSEPLSPVRESIMPRSAVVHP